MGSPEQRRRRQIRRGQLTEDNGLRYRRRVATPERTKDEGQDDGVFRRPAGQRVWRVKR